jgi:hypothetical protein
MGYNYNFVRTNLNYETETPYIKGRNCWKYSSTRYWFFEIQSSLTVAKDSQSGWSKMAFYLPPEGTTSATARLRMISDLNTTDSADWMANGVGSLVDLNYYPPAYPTPVWETKNWAVQTYPFYIQDIGSSQEAIDATFETNVPIFSNYNQALGYIQGLTPIRYALNYLREEEPENTYFEIYNTAQKDNWTTAGKTFIEGPYYRWARIKLASSQQTDGRLAFYRKGLEDGAIKLVPVIVANIVSCEYSTNGGADWIESNVFPFEYIYGERVDELGTFISATREGLGGDNGVPVFETLAAATGWVNHNPDVSIDMAINYEDIANRYKITNPTGAEETSTTLGDASNLKSYFSQEYVLSDAQLTEIANAFYDVGPQGIWESIKEGIEMMGSNPIDVIAGLKWFNFDISTFMTGLSPQSYIYFGGYQLNLTFGNVDKVIHHGGYKDLGTFTIQDAFPNPSDFRNFEPYCRLKTYIPTVGIQDLSYNKYRGKTVSVRAYVDIKSGNTLICFLADGVLYDYFNGSCGVDIPITLTDKAALGQAHLRNASNLAGVGINMGTAAATKDIGASIASVANFGSAMNALNNTSADQFNVTKGGSSPIGNACFLPNYLYLIFEYIKTAETANLNELEGRATNRSGSLNSFSGYLQIDSINLQTTGAMSESEKSEFVSLLQSGVFI